VRRVHGFSTAGNRHPLYWVWSSIKKRCLNASSEFYEYYGARGITIYPAWINDAGAFIVYVQTELGLKPSPSHSLDRKNNNGNYEPGNLRWANKTEQVINRRQYSEWKKHITPEQRREQARQAGQVSQRTRHERTTRRQDAGSGIYPTGRA
jgi:hypothetical protein